MRRCTAARTHASRRLSIQLLILITLFTSLMILCRRYAPPTAEKNMRRLRLQYARGRRMLLRAAHDSQEVGDNNCGLAIYDSTRI